MVALDKRRKMSHTVPNLCSYFNNMTYIYILVLFKVLRLSLFTFRRCACFREANFSRFITVIEIIKNNHVNYNINNEIPSRYLI